jgi:hypothetical protein
MRKKAITERTGKTTSCVVEVPEEVANTVETSNKIRRKNGLGVFSKRMAMRAVVLAGLAGNWLAILEVLQAEKAAIAPGRGRKKKDV